MSAIVIQPKRQKTRKKGEKKLVFLCSDKYIMQINYNIIKALIERQKNNKLTKEDQDLIDALYNYLSSIDKS